MYAPSFGVLTMTAPLRRTSTFDAVAPDHDRSTERFVPTLRTRAVSTMPGAVVDVVVVLVDVVVDVVVLVDVDVVVVGAVVVVVGAVVVVVAAVVVVVDPVVVVVVGWVRRNGPVTS